MDTSSWSSQRARDLAWLIAGPNLLAGGGRGAQAVDETWCQRAYLESLPWLEQLDQQWLAEEDHQPAHGATRPPQHPTQAQQAFRLGRYAEDLLAEWLGAYPRCKRMVHSLAVHDGQRTRGEFDFLWLDRQDHTLHHWELAVKFFLRAYPSDDPAAWLGPRANDSLGAKIDVLWNRQLKLGHTAPGKLAIADRFPKYNQLKPQALVKGYLYYPASEWPHCEPIPRGLCSDHDRGWWCHSSNLDQIPNDHRNSRWTIIDKPQWLSPVILNRSGSSRGAERVLSRGECLDAMVRHFNQQSAQQSAQQRNQQRALHIAELRPGLDGRWHERSRGFVVPPSWPQHISA